MKENPAFATAASLWLASIPRQQLICRMLIPTGDPKSRSPVANPCVSCPKLPLLDTCEDSGSVKAAGLVLLTSPVDSEYTNLLCRPLPVAGSHLPLMRILIGGAVPPQSSCPISRRQSWDLCLKACSVSQSGQLLSLACFFLFFACGSMVRFLWDFDHS